ncbi:MAG: patatin-like phospholipase family protein [Bacillota bacterium]
MRLGLALSGGVVRGLAHVGVLKALEEAGFRPDCIAGTSSGALIGALYAAGLTISELEKLAHRARWRDLARLTVPRRGLIDISRISQLLDRIVGHLDFSQLQTQLAVVACDITTGEEVVITSGDVAVAVQASCAIPGIFAPVRVGRRLLVDGGIVHNVPAAVCRRLGAQAVVAVDLSAFIPATKEPATIFEIILNSLHIIMDKHGERESSEADVVIRPPVADLSPIDLDSHDELIARGYRAALRALPAIQSLLE